MITPGTHVRIIVDDRNESSRGTRTITGGSGGYIRDGQTAVVMDDDSRMVSQHHVRLDDGHHWPVGEVYISERFLMPYDDASTPATPDEGTNMTTHEPLRERVWAYLTSGEGDTRMRMQALKDLAERGTFVGDSETITTRIVEEYLTDNPRGLCRDGVTRFRRALLAPAKRYTTVLLQLESDDHIDVDELCDVIRGLEVNGHTLADVAWWDAVRENANPVDEGVGTTRAITSNPDARNQNWRRRRR